MGELRKYTCSTAAETLDWIRAIVEFIRPYRFFFESHVVNFFKDRLWEALDREWLDCLRQEPVEHLLQIPSGVARANWPSSLKEFLATCRSLSFPREQARLEQILPDAVVAPLNSVLSQGMNHKKKHEVEVLAALVNDIARSVDSHTIVDVGSGQGYLAQVLSFQYKLSVLAIDGSLHHGEVTKSRAERIRKYYAAKMRKLGSQSCCLTMPKTITCRVLSASMLKNLSSQVESEEQQQIGKSPEDICLEGANGESICFAADGASHSNNSSLVLAGLHACGDLSVTMLRAFSECREVRAVVSIGCCYNLLSEDRTENHSSNCGFPMSNSLKSNGLSLGKSARDLACQSAERWGGLQEDAGIQNFDLHAFRAAFQMVLAKYYPEVLSKCPSIGRQGKALRRQQKRITRQSASDGHETCFHALRSSLSNILSWGFIGHDLPISRDKGVAESDGCGLFRAFSQSGLSHLGLEPLESLDLHGVWVQCEPFMELIGPYWSLRAALGPVLETLLLLDRLLFLQEQDGFFKVDVLQIFDPVLSPRNLGIVARKV